MLHKAVVGNPVANLENIQEILHSKGSIPNKATQQVVSDAQAKVAEKLKENFYNPKK